MSVTHCRVARHNLSVTVNDDWNTSCFKCNSSFVIIHCFLLYLLFTLLFYYSATQYSAESVKYKKA